MKYCKKCDTVKKESQFYKRNNTLWYCCKDCYRKIVKDRNDKIKKGEYKPTREILPKWAKTIYANLWKRSRRDGGKLIERDKRITTRFIVELREKQQNKCYYTGIEMDTSSKLKSPSLDRVDSSKGYLVDNVVICCRSINYAKHDSTEEEFNDFLKLLRADKSKQKN